MVFRLAYLLSEMSYGCATATGFALDRLETTAVLVAPLVFGCAVLPQTPKRSAYGATKELFHGGLCRPPSRPPARGSKEGGIPAASFFGNAPRASLWALKRLAREAGSKERPSKRPHGLI
jgi:hypothetical protein